MIWADIRLARGRWRACWCGGPLRAARLFQEWDWSEHFAGQPETLRYCNHVADKFDLRRDIQFRSLVTAAIWQEDTRSWNVTLKDGSQFRARFLITAIGPLSAPQIALLRVWRRNQRRDRSRVRDLHSST